MSPLLEQAIAALQQLPPDEQDRYAAWILEEIADDQRWDGAFAGSQEALAKLAERALSEHRAGQTQDLDADNL